LICDYLTIGRVAIVRQSRTTELHTFYIFGVGAIYRRLNRETGEQP
jgi:hypothetical protein